MNKRLLTNTYTAFLLQIITIVCNFVLPRLYLQFYSSEVNGLINSISQFLGFITLCELGVGQVIQSSLYKPLSEKDNTMLSCIVVSGKKFFRTIAYILSAYIVVLMVVFPLFSSVPFDAVYIITLIAAMSINSFSQYFFGIIDSLLLNADQRNYINSITQIACTLVNTAVCTILIVCGCRIQVVKLLSSLVLVIKPVITHIYIRKKYSIDPKIRYSGEPIKQKWNGIAQHVASYILSGTDVIVLTFFSTLGNVSVYSIYNMIANGINLLLHSFVGGVRSYCGRIWANQNMKELRRIFQVVEISFHSLSVFLYSCTAILIVPFVRVYTLNINDCDYVQPLFAFLLVMSYALQGIRIPYSVLIHIAGQYKQTQNCYIISAVINLVVSILLVLKWGLIGIAIGTVLSMLFQVLWLIIYNSKNILHLSLSSLAKVALMDIVSVLLIYIATKSVIPATMFIPKDYYGWFLLAVLVALLSVLVITIVLLLFYGKQLKPAVKKLLISKTKRP